MKKSLMNMAALALLVSSVSFAQVPTFTYRGEGNGSSEEAQKTRSKIEQQMKDFNPPAAEYFKPLDLFYFGFSPNCCSYTIGEDCQSYTATRYLKDFSINRYETTYLFWYTVKAAAEKKGYVFGNPGQEGSEGRRGKAPTQFNALQPVTQISWYDAIVWCNALSELYGRTPCYTYKNKVLRDSTDTASCDLAECSWDCDGYRLPSEAEWEYAARATKRGPQKGDLASGQVNEKGYSDSSIPATEVSWTFENTKCSMPVGTAGTPFKRETPPLSGNGNPNGLGLFDMTGNILEFCWDWQSDYAAVKKGECYYGPELGSARVCRGGSWSQYTPFNLAGDRYSYDPNEAYNYMGFRICTSSAK